MDSMTNEVIAADNEIIRNAVSVVMEEGIPVKKVVRDLDIHPNLLH